MGLPEVWNRGIGRGFVGILVVFAALLGLRGVTSACHMETSKPCLPEKHRAYFLEGTDLVRGGYLPPSIEEKGYLVALACPDIASTELFGSEGLEYVHTVEFAEAVFAVATGKSRFSPREVPAEWRTTAYAWGAHVAASDTMPALPGAGPAPVPLSLLERSSACSPFLLFRASLEYRSVSGHDDAPLVYPHKVRAATEIFTKELRDTTAIARTPSSTTGPARAPEGPPATAETDALYRQSVESAIRWISAHGEDPDR